MRTYKISWRMRLGGTREYNTRTSILPRIVVTGNIVLYKCTLYDRIYRIIENLYLPCQFENSCIIVYQANCCVLSCILLNFFVYVFSCIKIHDTRYTNSSCIVNKNHFSGLNGLELINTVIWPGQSIVFILHLYLIVLLNK